MREPNGVPIYQRWVYKAGDARPLWLYILAVIIVWAIFATEDTESTEELLVLTEILYVLCGRIFPAMAETTIKAYI